MGLIIFVFTTYNALKHVLYTHNWLMIIKQNNIYVFIPDINMIYNGH